MNPRPPDDIIEAIQSLPARDRLRIVERVIHDLAQETPAVQRPRETGPGPRSVIGLFSDQPDLIEQVCESAMVARERDPLRVPGA